MHKPDGKNEALGLGLACRACPASNPEALGERAGLLWIGTQFYPTPEHFMVEARHQGICRRITAVPRDFKAGETWVLLAHPKGATHPADPTASPPLEARQGAGIFYLWKPERIEKLVTETEARDAAAMADLERRGITPVAVPDGDRDHQGSVYDKPEDGEE